MIKKITLDTNDDTYGESANFFIEIIDNETGITTTEYPAFREVMDGVAPTGIYFTEVDLTVGNYIVIIKHNILTQNGSVHFTIEDDGHTDLENNIMGIIKDIDDGVAFA